MDSQATVPANPPLVVKPAITFLPYLTTFICSLAVMIIELMAGRLVGSHLGNSFYTWAAIIAVILAGNGLGNILGGLLVERQSSRQLLVKLLILAAISCIAALILNQFCAVYAPLKFASWPVRILGTIFVIFILPAVFLGAITPVVAKIAVEYSAKPGMTIGKFYACGAIGSISGTFLTGYCFIAMFSTTRILLLVGGLLILLAALPPLVYRRINTAALRLSPLPNCKVSQSGTDFRGGLFKPALWKYASRLMVFFSSGFLMMIELSAGRLISRYFGNSLYSWTSIIGVVLAGMAIGYLIGGRLAEEPQTAKFLGLFWGLSSICTLLILVDINNLQTSGLLDKFALPWQIFLTVLSSLLLPAITLSLISPITYKLTLADSAAPAYGFTIGSLNAWGMDGSILGTLGAGFWLISAFGVVEELLIISLFLALISWCCFFHRRLATVWLLTITALFGAAVIPPGWLLPQVTDFTQSLGLREATKGLIFAKDSKYQYVKVYEDFLDAHHDLYVLALDSLIHGYLDLKNPDDLQYEYEHLYRKVTRRYAGSMNSPKAFFIGGGSYTFPRWMLYQWPKARIDVAEIDPVVVEANFHALGLPGNTPIHTLVGDARTVVSNLPADAKYDFFYGDAFNDLSVPWHLTTLEFVKTIKRHLNPRGLYLLNIIDNYDNGLMVGASYLTLKRVFHHVYVFATNRLRIQNLRDTFILVASDIPMGTSEWTAGSGDGGDNAGLLLQQKNLDYLAKRCGGLILTDDYAPVENLLAPVVSRRHLR